MNKIVNALIALSLSTLACTVEQGSTELSDHSIAPLVFEDRYSSTGGVRVFETDSGMIVQVYGRTGQDDPVRAGHLLAMDSLDRLYLSLHPEASSAPAALLALDRRFAEYNELIAQHTPETPDADEELAGGSLVEKDQAAFLSNACITFSNSTNKWVPQECTYGNNVAVWQGGRVTTGRDRAYAWNDSSRVAEVMAVTEVGGLQLTSWVADQPPWTWSWYAWNYPSQPAKFGVKPRPPASTFTGGLGVTHHKWKAVIH